MWEILDNPKQILEEDKPNVYQGRFVVVNNKAHVLRIWTNDLINPQEIVTLYVISKLENIGRYQMQANYDAEVDVLTIT